MRLCCECGCRAGAVARLYNYQFEKLMREKRVRVRRGSSLGNYRGIDDDDFHLISPVIVAVRGRTCAATESYLEGLYAESLRVG